MKKAVIGIVDNTSEAETTVAALQQAGIKTTDVSVLLPDRSGTGDFAHEHHTKAPEGAVAGGSAGGVIGGTIGLLAGIGSLAIPGLGPFIAAGPIMAALSGAAAGAAVGGIAGALAGMGVPEYEAKRYEGKIRGGNILVAVHVETPEARDAAERVLKQYGARDIAATSESTVPRRARPHS